MRLRFIPLALAAALIAASAVCGPARAEPGVWTETPDKLPRAPRGDRFKNLDFLFEALKAAPDADSAKLVEGRIWALWLASGSDTTDLMMSRVKGAIDGKDTKDYSKSLSDIRQVLAREPRHFGALTGLGVIMQEFGEDKRALEVFRRALAVNPHLQKVPDFVKSLTEKVEGRDI
jgi:tetratricopeptide (TPR) repeat protein